MSSEVLKLISDAMAEMNLNYEFLEWTSEIVYPYFVGEYVEGDPLTEDGLQESQFILTGFTRTTWIALEEAKEDVEKYFNPISGKIVISNSGNGIAIFYSNSTPIPTGDAELKKIQITLNIKEWKVN